MEEIKRFRNFACITYATEEQISRFLCHYRRDIKHYAYAYHDKDDNEPHTHIILLWHNGMSTSALKKRFKRFTDQNTLVEVLLDKTACYQYLTHENDDDKYHYDIGIIKSDSSSYWQAVVYEEEEDDNKALSIVNDILAGVPLPIMLKRYGTHFVINFDKYQSFAKQMLMYDRERAHLIDDDGVIVR